MQVHFEISRDDFGSFQCGAEVAVICKENCNLANSGKLQISADPDEISMFHTEDEVYMVKRVKS
jgi:hypothetical protein